MTDKPGVNQTTADWLRGVPELYPQQNPGETIVVEKVAENLLDELALRRKQIGLLANCLSHIQSSPIAHVNIRIAATAALAGAAEIARQIEEFANE